MTEVPHNKKQAALDRAESRRRGEFATDQTQEQRPAVARLKISDVVIRGDRREVTPEAVAAMAESYDVIGQKVPVSVRPDPSEPGKYKLIAGKIRVDAAASRGWTHIDCVVEEGDDTDAELWQLAENLHRLELSVMDESVAIARWVALKRARDGQVVQKSKRGRPKTGKAAAARALPVPGKSEGAKRKAVERAIQISEIIEEAKKAAKAAGLDDNQEALLEIACESGSEAQLKKVAELGARKSFRSAATKHGAEPDLLTVSAPTLQPVESANHDADAVDLLVFTPDAAQVARFGQNYAEEDKVERALPLLIKQIAKDAAVVVFARIRDLPVIIDRLLPVCGFRARCRVLLARRPNTSDITDCDAIVVAERGGLTAPTSGEWVDANEPIDPLALAASMYPDAKNRVNVFASARIEGWQCLLASESWAEK